MRHEWDIIPGEAPAAMRNRVALDMSAALGDADALDVLRYGRELFAERMAVVSSFGAESVVLLHLAWVTGRKRHQTQDRAAMNVVEVDHADRIKINPLANWTVSDIADYMDAHDLPRHPLVAEGFQSIGCAPCTTKTLPGEDPRAGRRLKTF